ncbi:MAG: tetratricopeptide repeat protein [bacterium]
MASTARTDELKKKFDENPRRYFAPLANEFRKAGEIEQAILICEEFLPQQPGHMSGHIVYGQALYEAGRMLDSRAVFETALGLDPENLIALRHLGDIARGQDDAIAARGWYVRVLYADPRNEEIQALIDTLDREAPPLEHEDPAAASVFLDAPSTSLDLDIEKEVPPFEREYAPAPAPIDKGDTSLIATSPIGVPVISLEPPPIPPSVDVLDGFTLHGFDTAPATADAASHAPAEGLESTAFEPPVEAVPQVADLDDSLDSGVPSFAAPSHHVETLAGLHGSGDELHVPESASAQASAEALEPLDIDDGMMLPPHGDPLDAVAEAPAMLGHEPDQLPEFDIEAPDSATTDSEPPVMRHEADELPDLDVDTLEDESYDTDADIDAEIDDASSDTDGDARESSIPTELPPAVIAAEAALTRTSSPRAADTPRESASEATVVPGTPFVTETMAELYVAQGHPERARAVYEQLLAAKPYDERLRGLLASLSWGSEAEAAGPNVREFFARIALRRAGSRTAAAMPPADDDFGPAREADLTPPLGEKADAGAAPDAPHSVADAEGVDVDADADIAVETTRAIVFESPASSAPVEPPAAPVQPSSAAGPVTPALERVARMRTPDGSIDALFGNRPPGTSEDSAASALAQAFGGEAEAPPAISGRPAHAASGELSLDSVFRDGPARPPRTSQSFSFDQFFRGAENRASTGTPQRTSSEVPMPGDIAAEHGEDDIEQFNSWLQGLKQR